MSNFNEFKKPKKFHSNEKFIQMFINDYYMAIAAKRLFESMVNEEYNSVFTLLKHMLRSDNDNYFNWLARILLKTFVVKFLAESEVSMKEKPQ